MPVTQHEKRGVANALRSNRKRTNEQEEADTIFCSALFLKGHTYRYIANALNERNAAAGLTYKMTFQQIYNDIKELLIRWKKESFDNIDMYMTAELQKLDVMESELWDAWHRSKNGRRRTKSKGQGKQQDKGNEIQILDEVEVIEEDTNGDPRYFDLILNIQQRRSKLLGYDPSVKNDSQKPKDNTGEEKEYGLDCISEQMLLEAATTMMRRRSESENNIESDEFEDFDNNL